MTTPGPIALVGGDEFHPGNEPIDRFLAENRADGPAFVLATAAARQGPAQAVRNARRWFGDIGLDVEELPATKTSHTKDLSNVARARSGTFFYLVGGDPGLVPRLLAGSPLWEAIWEAWRGGAGLAGSSAGAMALGEWTLIRDRMPGDNRRRYAPALAVIPRVAVLPHYDTFGHEWLDSALANAPEGAVLVGPDERTAAVWGAEGWRVLGAGRVSVTAGSSTRSYGSGDMIVGLPDPIL